MSTKGLLVHSFYSLNLCNWRVYELAQPQENSITAGILELTSLELVACTS